MLIRVNYFSEFIYILKVISVEGDNSRYNVIEINTSLNVYDLNGQEVQNIYVDTNKQITINREQLASGMYFYQLVNNTKEVVATRKMVVE